MVATWASQNKFLKTKLVTVVQNFTPNKKKNSGTLAASTLINAFAWSIN
jgi:hypothetical protein